jgi:hypothetical protein
METKIENFKNKADEAKTAEFKTTSDKIRYLNSKGYTRMQIAKLLGKRYQHVRNVLVADALVKKD